MIGQHGHRPAFILASSSPQRRQLLRDAGYNFQAIAPPFPEPVDWCIEMPPAQRAEALAYFKARCVFETSAATVPVLGADTIVALGEAVFGKPRDAAHARDILAALAGTRHQVITGLALIDPGGVRLVVSDVTHVRMRAMSSAEMEAYIAAGQWRGKAGAYGIQDSNDAFVADYEGSFTNVMGLPMERLAGLFGQLLLRYCP